MRRLFIVSTVLFWLAVAGFGVASLWTTTEPAATPGTPGGAAADSGEPAADRSFALEEVAHHATESDCWMAIAGEVYDLTPYLPRHPSEPELILPWCGRDATDAYRTKTLGRPHSPRADRLLSGFRIGALQ